MVESRKEDGDMICDMAGVLDGSDEVEWDGMVTDLDTGIRAKLYKDLMSMTEPLREECNDAF